MDEIRNLFSYQQEDAFLPITTIHHEPIVYRVHDLITEANPVRWFTIEELCMISYDEYTPSLDTAMREIIREICLDEIFKTVIITGRSGVKAAENDDEVSEYLRKALKTASAHFDRYWTTRRKWSKDMQQAMKIGKYDMTEIVAVIREEANE